MIENPALQLNLAHPRKASLLRVYCITLLTRKARVNKGQRNRIHVLHTPLTLQIISRQATPNARPVELIAHKTLAILLQPNNNLPNHPAQQTIYTIVITFSATSASAIPAGVPTAGGRAA